MKKLLSIILTMSAVMFSACSDDDNDKSSPKSIITNGELRVCNIIDYPDDMLEIELQLDPNTVIASVTPACNSFTMTLPDPVSDDLLTITLGDRYPDKIHVSNPDVKASLASLRVKKSNEYEFKSIGLAKYGNNYTIGRLVYCNGNCDVTGEYEEYPPNGGKTTYIYNYRLKKGWNLIYEKIASDYREHIRTTSHISGLKWYYRCMTLD